MKPAEDSPVIIMDHAYAEQNNMTVPIKIENNDSEMIELNYIKLEDVSIKSEIHDDDTDFNTLPCEYDFDTSHIKKEDFVDITEQNEVDSIRDNTSLKDELEIAKQKIIELTEENNLLKAENELLKLEVRQYSQSNAETIVLKETIKSYQTELLAFEELKRYHQQIENQLIQLKSKMTDFAEVVIPSMKKNHLKQVQQLNNEVESKNKSLLNLNKKIHRLVKRINDINIKLTSVNETSRNNYLKQSDRADEYEAKWKTAVENQKDLKSEIKLRENELSKKTQELNKLVKTYSTFLQTYGNCLKHNGKLIADIDELKKQLYDEIEANTNLRTELDEANIKISELCPCKYCGL